MQVNMFCGNESKEHIDGDFRQLETLAKVREYLNATFNDIGLSTFKFYSLPVSLYRQSRGIRLQRN